MSGRKQHHIPQSLLRAWEIPSKGKKTQVWVFSKRNTFWGSTEGVAAERDFYSEPSADGTKTLDDLITDYEARFTKQITALRSLAIGATADPAVAAEVIAHLTIRNAHLRSSIAGGVRSLVEQAADLLFNEKNIRTIFGIDGKQFSPAMTARVDEEIGRDPRFAATGLPREVLHKIGFMAMKENFSHFVTDSLPSMQQALNLLANDAPIFMRKGQNMALFAGLAPDRRTAALAKLKWTVCNGPESGVILPDCVALGVEGEGSPQPLIMSDLAKLDFVLMPLTPSTMLIGARGDGANPSLERFNADAAACSHEFFVSGRDGNDRDALVPLLGTRSKLTVDAAIQSAFEGFKDERGIPGAKSENEAVPDAEREASRVLKPLNYLVSFYGVADKATADRIATVLNEVVRELRPMMALDRLDGVTFAEDYEDALRNLDRGFETGRPLESTKYDYGVGVAMTPIVRRDGIIKSHLVARMWIANGLISGNEKDQQLALHTIIAQLAHAACNQLLDEAFPGFFMNRLEDSLQAFLYPCVDSAWSGYFAARASAIFDPESEAAYRELTLSALRHAEASIPPAQLAYQLDHDMDKLVAVVLPTITAILRHLAYLLGHCDGLQRVALDDDELAAAFQRARLSSWAELFQGDLATIWDRKGRWASLDEFFQLNRHAERLLWACGMFPWKTENGGIWIQVSFSNGPQPRVSGPARLWAQAIGYVKRFFGRQ